MNKLHADLCLAFEWRFRSLKITIAMLYYYECAKFISYHNRNFISRNSVKLLALIPRLNNSQKIPPSHTSICKHVTNLALECLLTMLTF